MIGEISHFLSFLSGLIFLAVFLLSIPMYSSSSSLQRFVPNIFFVAVLSLILSFSLFVYLALTDDFSMRYIASHSNTNLPGFYKVSSIWSAHEGSLFLWIVFLGLWGIIFWLFYNSKEDLYVETLGIISLILFLFLAFLLLVSSPFERLLPISPFEGNDINPVLQDPALAIHPPMLYLGYVGFIIAFAFNSAYLIKQDFTEYPVARIKNFSLIAWAFLTLGITLGSWWAYYELGWGGYWFWDPVENVALMPWLAATALVHMLFVSNQSKSIKAWTIFLSLLVFALSLFGAFIVRSGIIDSVHSFANDPTRGLYLLLISSVIVSIPLFYYLRFLPNLFSQQSIKVLSKEYFISLNNVLFLTGIFIIFLGVLYPLFMEFFFDDRISVGAPYYNLLFAPLAFVAASTMVLSTESLWSRPNSLQEILRGNLIASIASSIATVIIALLTDTFAWWFLGGLFFSLLIFFKYLQSVIISYLDQTKVNVASMIAHFGFGMLIMTISLNAALSSEKTFSMKTGSSAIFADYNFTFDNLSKLSKSNHDVLEATFIFEDDKNKFLLKPQKRKYFTRGEITTESAIKIFPLHDVYITIGEQQTSGGWIVNVQLNYYTRWIWVAAVIMTLGILLSMRKKKYV